MWGTGMGNSQKLSRQQEIFADLLFKTGKQSDAYREAYPRSKAWKQAHVHHKACLLAKNVKVMQRLSELEAAKQAKYEAEAKRQGLDAETVIREQGYTAFANIADCFTDDGRLLPIKQMPEHMQRAVKKLKIRGVKTDDDSVQGVVAEIELNDKLKALKDIGEHLGMYRKIHEHHWVDDLAKMTEAELEAEEQRIDAELAQAMVERHQSGLQG